MTALGRLVRHLRDATPVVVALVAWLLFATGAINVSLGLGLIWLGRQIRPHAGWFGAVVGATLAFLGWATAAFGGLLIAAGLALTRLPAGPPHRVRSVPAGS